MGETDNLWTTWFLLWTSSVKPADEDPGEALEALAQRVRRTMDGWSDVVKVLRIVVAK